MRARMRDAGEKRPKCISAFASSSEHAHTQACVVGTDHSDLTTAGDISQHSQQDHTYKSTTRSTHARKTTGTSKVKLVVYLQVEYLQADSLHRWGALGQERLYDAKRVRVTRNQLRQLRPRPTPRTPRQSRLVNAPGRHRGNQQAHLCSFHTNKDDEHGERNNSYET